MISRKASNLGNIAQKQVYLAYDPTTILCFRTRELGREKRLNKPALNA
jgi:hypothetical protein